MKNILPFLTFTILIISCQNNQEQIEIVNNFESIGTRKNNANSIQGLYFNGTNELDIKELSKDTLDIQLTIANQQCAMPTFKGVLSKIYNNEFEGLINSSLDDFENDTLHLMITIKDSLIEVKSNDSREKWQLGAACWVEGKYSKN